MMRAPANMPEASVIIATYNRPGTLELAIRSLLRSEFERFEVIIVGDGCGPQTEAAVRAFDDPRLHYENLPENTGGQAAPNNRGLDLARGEFVLFLNHDDMVFPDHVGRCVDRLSRGDADVVWGPVALLQTSGRTSGPPDPTTDRIILDGASSDGRFEPSVFVIASSWAVRRACFDRAGPWASECDQRITPSQEWLFRASNSGLRFAYDPYPSVLCIHSGVRRGSYASRHEVEHARAWSWIEAGAEGRAQILSCVAVNQAADLRRFHAMLKPETDRQIEALAGRFGVHPMELQRFLSGLSPGEWIAQTRAFTELVSDLEPDATINAGAPEADAILTYGWHRAEPAGRWSRTERAGIVFKRAAAEPGDTLVLSLTPFNPDETVKVSVGATVAVERRTAPGEPVEIPLALEDVVVEIGVEVERCVSPQSLGRSDDARPLGVLLHTVRLERRTGG